MSVEVATFIGQLAPANPPSTDGVKEGDNHIRLIKQSLQNTFPGLTFAITFNETTKVVLEAATLSGMRTALGAVGLADDNTFTGTMRIQHTLDGAAVSTRLDLARINTTPAVDDLLHLVRWLGRNSAAVEAVYTAQGAQIKNKTSGAEAGEFYWQTAYAGVLATRLRLGRGLYTPNAIDGDKGPDTINASEIYEAGVRVGNLAVVGEMRNLAMATASVSTVAYSLDEVVLMNALGQKKLYSAKSGTLNIATSGANGLDTGVEANGHYAIWLVGKADGTLAALLSASFSAPTLPADYTFYGLFGWVRNEAGDFIPFVQHDRQINFKPQLVLNNGVVTTPGTYQSLSVATYIPTIARRIGGAVGRTTNASESTFGIVVAGDVDGCGSQGWGAWSNSGGLLMEGLYSRAGFSDIVLRTAQTLYWTAMTTSANSGISLSQVTI